MSFFDLVVGKPLTTTEERAEHMSLLTGHVENGVYRGLFSYQPDGLTGRHDDQFDVAAFRLKFHFLHNWQTPVRSGADHKPVAFPGYLFSDGQGRMPKLVTEFPRGAFLPLRISPRSITTSCSYALPSIRRVPKENLSKRIRASSCCRVQALFFEVTAEKTDQLCSTS